MPKPFKARQSTLAGLSVCARRTWHDLNRYAAGKAEPVDAEVVEHDPIQEARRVGILDEFQNERPIDTAIAEADEAERIEDLRKRANELLDQAAGFDDEGDARRATEARDEAEALMDQVDAAQPQPPEQGSLGL